MSSQIKTPFLKLYKNLFSINIPGNIIFSRINFSKSCLNQQMRASRSMFLCRKRHSDCAKGGVKVSADDPDLLTFDDAYDHVQKAVLYTNDKALVDVFNWTAKVVDYNVQGGKKIRGLTVLKSFKLLSEEQLSTDRILEACVLGWCVELLQGFFLVADDIMDESAKRRGKPCWYKLPDVGLIAINDSLLLECSIYKVLETYFKKSKAYNNIVHEFLQVSRVTVYGQCLDMLNVPPNGRPKFENFNLEKYYAVVKYKTSHYTFCLPVHLSMHLVGNFTEKEFELTKNICLKLGLLFQIQDDYLDVFGDPSITGKIGTDINDGKCTWFSASFFECASESMKKVMIENYGVNSESSVSQVKKMYEDLALEDKFRECEQTLIKEINGMIETLSRDSLKTLFQSLLKMLYQRKK